ncbi:hypothetical protein [Myceligenerans xiligouense]|uniref:Uncharacterized protein n=1 Tax=Myceligenerans xiligouense TaxID=253184 RepID=A0A3N4YKS2_9MICO|nr:hypothetical protein [Myceligenerans xiligouense]RPF21323.1 hypothetical protein EDD34_1950 [Myceligenerans xiligouense]
MNEALWGVVIGGAIGFLTALSSAVIGPLLAARQERLRERAARLHKAIEGCREPLTAWSSAVTDVAVELPSSEANRPALANPLRSALNAFTIVNDDALRRSVATAISEVGRATFASEWVTYKASSATPPQEVLDEVARVATAADLAVRDVWDRALDLADPPSIFRRLMRRAESHRALGRDEQIEQAVKALGETRNLAIRLKGER